MNLTKYVILTITVLCSQYVKAGPAVSGGIGSAARIQCTGFLNDGTEITYKALPSAVMTARIGLLQYAATEEVISTHICQRVTGIDVLNRKERIWNCTDSGKVSGLSVIINEDETATVRKMYPLPLKDIGVLGCR